MDQFERERRESSLPRPHDMWDMDNYNQSLTEADISRLTAKAGNMGIPVPGVPLADQYDDSGSVCADNVVVPVHFGS